MTDPLGASEKSKVCGQPDDIRVGSVGPIVGKPRCGVLNW